MNTGDPATSVTPARAGEQSTAACAMSTPSWIDPRLDVASGAYDHPSLPAAPTLSSAAAINARVLLTPYSAMKLPIRGPWLLPSSVS